MNENSFFTFSKLFMKKKTKPMKRIQQSIICTLHNIEIFYNERQKIFTHILKKVNENIRFAVVF